MADGKPTEYGDSNTMDIETQEKRRPPTIYDRESWLAMREDARQNVWLGASQVASALGLNPYEPQFVLFQKLTGRLPADQETIPMRVGKHDEPLVAQLYSEATGIALHTPGEYAVYRHPDIEWLFATPDYERFQIDPEPVETKRSDSVQTHRWKDGLCPIEFDVQNIVQMACMGASAGVVVGLIGYKLHIVEREFNAATWEWAVDRLDRFRWSVLKDIPPEVDGSTATREALKLLHPKDNGETVELPEDIAKSVHHLDVIKQTIKGLEDEAQALDNKIRAAIGDNTYAAVDGVPVLSLKTQTRKGFTVQPAEYRVLRKVKA